MTLNRFEQYLKQHMKEPYPIVSEKNGELLIRYSPVQSSPFLLDQDGTPYLLSAKDDHCFLPELAVHYLLLYNLSMICRYETEWWGELLHNFDGTDLPFIVKFLDLVQEKAPELIMAHLQKP